MGSGMEEHFTPSADRSARSAGFTSQLSRVLLGLLRGALRFLLVAVLDVVILAVRLRLAAFALGTGFLMMTLSRASLLLNDRLRFCQLQLHAWAQGWPMKRYAFTALPPRR